MGWVSRIGIAVAVVAIACVAIAARADDQPRYATMVGSGRSWTPPPEAPPQRLQPPQQQPVAAPTQPVQQQALPAVQPQTLPLAQVAAAPPPQRIAMVPQPSYSSRGTADYRLDTGDKVRVTVFGEEDLSGEFQVDSTGFLRLPMIGQLRAAGLTAHALEGTLMQAYANGYLLEPKVSVEVTTYRPFYIIGEVNKPGEYAYVNGMNALNAVALAGGFTSKAVQGHVYLRKNGATREVEVPADQTTQILPGDIVRVTSSSFWDLMDVVTPLAGFYRPY
jgi:protein involved in polysaccharide export with SLBB domain